MYVRTDGWMHAYIQWMHLTLQRTATWMSCPIFTCQNFQFAGIYRFSSQLEKARLPGVVLRSAGIMCDRVPVQEILHESLYMCICTWGCPVSNIEASMFSEVSTTQI